ncbi:MAG: twin-arginine translocase subunit TatB [Sphingomonadales bacterium]|nr:twin-arginine translocase subunit TatB [Sphingomonadales bacterium]
MFDIGWDEMLFTAIVAIVVIGPKDLPRALRTAGQWMGKMRRMSNHFRSGIETMIREAELEEMEKQWREKNAAVMNEHPIGAPGDPPPVGPDPGTETRFMTPLPTDAPADPASPQLPLPGPKAE